MSAPNSVIELAEARQAARANKDFALADSLRDQIFAAGFEVADVAGGFELTEKARFPVIAKLRELKALNLPTHEITALLVIEGFIHCSTEAQVQGVLERYYADKTNLVKLVIDTNLLTHPLKYEFSPSIEEEFPHIFGTINLEAVINPIDL